MRIILFVICVAMLAWVSPAQAQNVFANPFASVAEIRAARGATPDATVRLRYEVTRNERGEGDVTAEMVIDLAADWSLVRFGDEITLHDFRLNRSFALEPAAQRFTSYNAFGDPVFRVAETQNRFGLMRITASLGPQAQMFDACDIVTELGLALPGAPSPSTEFRERRGETQLLCGGREVSAFSAGDTAAMASFWPTMMRSMTTHTALAARVRDSGRYPATLSMTFRTDPQHVTRRAWRLIGVENVQTPYPLDAGFNNASAAAMDALLPGAGALGVEAVAGRAAGGAPTLETWDRHLADLSRREGPAAAAMMVMPTLNMFPELQTACAGANTYTACATLRALGTARDPGPRSLLQIAMAEQSRNPAAAIAAMQQAQTSDFRDHPALAASFALALLQFDQNALAQAQAANLPTDVGALQSRALQALPYNPAYWTDVGDRFAAGYDWSSALLFYDVAASLPMPTAVQGPAPSAKRSVLERVRRDFPDFFLASN